MQSLIFFACGIALTVLRLKKPELYLADCREESNAVSQVKCDNENGMTPDNEISAAEIEKPSPETVSETDLTSSADKPTDSDKK